MDRGRAGGYVGNNYVQVQLNKKKRQQHLERIQKIKGRKPGSSATLDNNPPMVIEAMLNDPRKAALRDQYNFVTERENKVLLKRISAILTAPPKITDKEYQEMKRLVVPNTKGFRKLYENGVTMQKNKEFFVHLKTLQPFYKAKEWELDYQKQLFNQRFMRQVKYKRPPGFVDPLLNPSEASVSVDNKSNAGDASSPGTAPSPVGAARHDRKSASMITHGGGHGGASLASLGGGKTSSSHVGRVRAVRHDNVNKLSKSDSGGSQGPSSRSSSGRLRRDTNSPSGRRHRGGDDNQSAAGDDENDDYGYDGFDDQDDDHSHPGSGGGIRMNVYEGGEGDYDHDSFYREGEDGFGEGNSGSDENRVQLAISHRPIRITDENASDSLHSTDLLGSNQHAEADIQCWLINQEYVVISATTLDKGRSLDAEAEISVADLSVIRGLPPDQSLLTDIPAMEAIAREMVENVELRVDGGMSRLVLNLVSDGDDEDAEYQLSDNEGMAGPGGGGSQALQAGSMSLVSEEEIEAMLLADRNQTVLIKGARIPVAFNVNANAQSIGSITALIELAKRAKRIEFIYVLLKMSSTSDDQMSVVAHFMSNTTFMFKRGSKHRPAVTAGSFVVTTTSLPSVIQADPDMLLTFAENLSLNLKVEHDCKTGENELIIVGI